MPIDLTVEDRLELHELYARHSHTVDAFDGEAYALCFTKDGIFATATGRLAGKVFRGRDQLARLGSDRDREPPTKHWTSNILFTPREDYVEGSCYSMRIQSDGAAPMIASIAVFQDEIVHEDGAWRFRARRPRLDLERPLDDPSPDD